MSLSSRFHPFSRCSESSGWWRAFRPSRTWWRTQRSNTGTDAWKERRSTTKDKTEAEPQEIPVSEKTVSTETRLPASGKRLCLLCGNVKQYFLPPLIPSKLHMNLIRLLLNWCGCFNFTDLCWWDAVTPMRQTFSPRFWAETAEKVMNSIVPWFSDGLWFCSVNKYL